MSQKDENSFVIKYIGNDIHYWEKLMERFLQKYSTLNIDFITEPIGPGFHPPTSFIKTYRESADIIYLDFTDHEEQMLKLAKLLCQNNEIRLKSVTGLHSLNENKEQVNRALMAGVRLNHYKSMEIEDVVYDPVSLFDVELAVNPDFAYGKDVGDVTLRQLLRVGYIDNDHFRVETNAKLPMEKVLEVLHHPIEHIMESKRVLVSRERDYDVYYNQRFNYHLKFVYKDDHFFRSTEQSWLRYRKYRDNPLGYDKDFPNKLDTSFASMNTEVDQRRDLIRPIKKKIKAWIDDKKDDNTPKRLKILVVDETLDIFKQLDGKGKEFPYTINIQTQLVKNYFQVKRTMPHLIAFHFSEDINNLNVLKNIIFEINSFKEDYAPYILVFNNKKSSIEMRKNLHYENVISYSELINIDIIKEMAKKIDEKLMVSHTRDRVYIKKGYPDGYITVEREAKIIAMTESVMYIKALFPIPLWTCFSITTPVKMLITIVPHKKDGRFSREDNCYRCLINGYTQEDKRTLRRLVNKSLEELDDSKRK